MEFAPQSRRQSLFSRYCGGGLRSSSSRRLALLLIGLLLVATEWSPLLTVMGHSRYGENMPLENRAVLSARVIEKPGSLSQAWYQHSCQGEPHNRTRASIGFIPSAFSTPLRPSVDGSNEVRMLLPGKGQNQAFRMINGCEPYSPRAYDNETWFDNGSIQFASANLCALSTRIYHASLVGLRLITFFRRPILSANLDLLGRPKSSQPWPVYRYGNSTDPNLDVTAWLAAQPAGEGYGFASPYPEPSLVLIGATENGLMTQALVSPYEKISSCGAVIKLAFTLPGSMVSSERLALRELASALVMPSTVDLAAVGYGSRLPLSALLDAPPSADPCTMGLAGVWCENGHLVSLNLADLQLAGELPSSISNFTQLRALQMPNNQLNGTLPSALCNLPLVIIDVSINRLTGIADCFCGSRTSVDQLESVIVPLGQADSLGYDANPYVTPNATTGYPLLAFDAATNDLSNLPVSILGCGNLRKLRLSQNRMASPPLPDLVNRNWPELESIDLDQAGITGRVPTFQGLQHLESINIGRNSFTGTLRPTSFDDLALIQTIKAANLGNITGAFPSFKVAGEYGNAYLKTIVLSGNRLRGKFPPVPLLTMGEREIWRVLTTLALDGNILLPPFNMPFQNLESLDLTRCGLTCLDTDFTDFLLQLTSAAYSVGMPLKKLLLAHNNLNCTWSSAAWSGVSAAESPVLGDLAILNVSGNFLHGSLPSSLFKADAPQKWELLDLSSNAFSGKLPPMPTPLTSLHTFDARGNPLMRRDPQSLTRPFYITDIASPIRISLDSVRCPLLRYVINYGTLIDLDASYTNYEGCECDRGYFGQPPDCTSVPSATNWTYRLDEATTTFQTQMSTSSHDDVAQALIVNQSFSDGYYGGQRFSAGMTTTFTMRAASSLTARVLTVTLFLNPAHLDSYTDLLSIYEGGDDLKGVRVFSVHGSDFTSNALANGLSYASSYESATLIPIRTLNPSDFESLALRESVVSNAPAGGKAYMDSQWSSMSMLYVLSIPVFSPSATLHFQSLDTSGVHFVASFVTSATCPPGLEPDSTPGSTKCLAVSTATSTIRNVVFLVAAVSLAATLWSLLGVIRFRDHDIIRGASPWCLVLMCGFMLALSCGSMMFAVLPQLNNDGSSDGSSSVVCDLRVWLTSVPLVGVLAVLLAKSNRVVSIFSTKTLKRRTVTDTEVLISVAVLVALQVAMCAAFSAMRLSQPHLVPGFGTTNGSGILTLQCSREPGFYSWLSLQVACCGLMTLWAGVLAFRTRDVISAFNESVHLANAIFTLIFIAATVIPVSILVADQQDAIVLLQGLSVALLVIVWNIALFAPKFYYISTGRAFQAVAQIRRAVARSRHGTVKLQDVGLALPVEPEMVQPSAKSVPRQHSPPSHAQRLPIADGSLAMPRASDLPFDHASQMRTIPSRSVLHTDGASSLAIPVPPYPSRVSGVVTVEHRTEGSTLPPSPDTAPAAAAVATGNGLQLLSLLSHSTSGDSSIDRQRDLRLAGQSPSFSRLSSPQLKPASLGTTGSGVCDIDRDVLPEFESDSEAPPEPSPSGFRFLPGAAQSIQPSFVPATKARRSAVASADTDADSYTT